MTDLRPACSRGCTDAEGAPKPADTFNAGQAVCAACSLRLEFPEGAPWPVQACSRWAPFASIPCSSGCGRYYETNIEAETCSDGRCDGTPNRGPWTPPDEPAYVHDTDGDGEFLIVGVS